MIVRHEVGGLISTRVFILVSIIADSLLLMISAVALWLVQKLGEELHLTGFALWYWHAMEVILAIGSLVVVVLIVIEDIRAARRRLRAGGSHEHTGADQPESSADAGQPESSA